MDELRGKLLRWLASLAASPRRSGAIVMSSGRCRS